VARKADQPSRKPVNRWTTKEMAHLVLPNPRTDPEAHQVFMVRYHEATGYAYDEKMPLPHALNLITGLDRPSRAWVRAKQYLAYGIPTFPQRDTETMRKAILDDGMFLVTRQFTNKEAEEFLKQYQAGLSYWQFLHLAGLLARAKESMRATASKQNLGKNLGITPARRQKKQAKTALKK
jgi:hypothetical protein